MRSSYYKDFFTSRNFVVEIRFRDDPFFVDVVLSLTIVEPYRIRTFSAHRSYYSGVISICFRAVIKSNVFQDKLDRARERRSQTWGASEATRGRVFDFKNRNQAGPITPNDWLIRYKTPFEPIVLLKMKKRKVREKWKIMYCITCKLSLDSIG